MSFYNPGDFGLLGDWALWKFALPWLQKNGMTTPAEDVEEGQNPLPTNASNMDFWAQDEDFYDTNYAQMLYGMEEAQKSRDWSEMMSNTAYQRAMSDLQAAGLNPIMATQYAANVPNATFASGGSGESKASRYYHYATGTSNLVGSVAKVMSGLGELLSYKYPRMSKKV